MVRVDVDESYVPDLPVTPVPVKVMVDIV